MTNQNLENTFNYMTSNQPMMSSKEIAELTEKHHNHVLRDIKQMLQTLDLINNPNLGCQQYQIFKREDNKQIKEIFLDKELTLTLVSGYNVILRHKIIKRWQELETKQTPKAPTTLLEALELAIKKEKENLALKQQLQEAQPKIEFHDTVESSNTLLSMNDFAKLLTKQYGVKIGQNKLMNHLRETGYLMIGRDLSERNKPYQKYMDLGYFEFKYVNTPKGLSVQSFITPKGQINLAKKIVDHFQTV